MASSTRDILIRILTKGDPKGADGITKSLDAMAEQATKTGKTLSLSVTAPLTAMAALAVKTYAVQENAERELAAAIKSTGGEVDTLLAKYKALGSEIQAQTIIGDEQTLGLIATATQMGITSDQMETTIKGAIGLSKAFGLDLTMATRASAAALQGNTSLLTRYIPQLQGVTDESEKLRLVTEGMARGFTQAQAEAAGASGQIIQAKNAMGDLLEVIGEQLAPHVVELAGGLKSIAENAQDISPAALNAALALSGIAASAGPVLIAVGAVLKYRNAIKTTSAVAGPWLIIAAAMATAYTAIKTEADAATDANQKFRDSIGLGDTSYVDSILGAKDQDALDLAITQTETKLAGLTGAIADQKKQLAEEASFFESGIADALVKKGLREELELMEAQAETLRDAIALGRERGAALIAQNAPLEKTAETQAAIVELTQEEQDLRNSAIADIDAEIALLDAKLANNEALVASLEDQKREQMIINQLKQSGVTIADATAKAEELVAKQRQLREQKSHPSSTGDDGNGDLRTRLTLLDQVGAKEQQQAQLKKGYRSEEIIGVDGQSSTRYFDQRGSIVDESQAFGQQPSSQAAPSQTQPTADIEPAVSAINSGAALDLSPILQAVAAVYQSQQSQINDLASQLTQLKN
ncbi:hypothetical protein ACWPKS_15990 [Coraliomargarita sp. W4R72]